MTEAFAPYDKINDLFKRDQKGNFLWGDWATPEIQYLAKNDWIWTEKVDGTKIRLGLDRDRPWPNWSIGGRTDNAQIPPKLLTALEGIAEDIIAASGEVFIGAKYVTLYGEGYGAGIQKGGGNYRQDNGFVLFDVLINTWEGESWWLKREDVAEVAERLNLDVVEIVHVGSVFNAIDIVRNREFDSAWVGVEQPEGLVGRPAVEVLDRRGKRIATKVKWKDVKVS